MNKKELIGLVSEKAKISKAQCGRVISYMTDIVTDALNKGDSVYLSELGKFEVKTRAERRIINPQTLREMYILPKKVPVFKCSKKFKEAVVK